MSAATESLEVCRSEVERAPATDVSIRPLRGGDLDMADRIFRLAFGTFIGLPDPSAFFEGRDFIRPRWHVDPSASLGAECDGELIGSNLAAAWGSVGFFGPLTVRPDMWDRGVGKLLLAGTMSLFDSWHIRHAGLFTFAQSPKHVGLYEKFGFYPRFLTAIMTRLVESPSGQRDVLRFSSLPESRQAEALRACRELTELLFEGLSLESEIRAVRQHKLGDTLLLWDDSGLSGFAVCHFGRGTEGGGSCCYVKFAAARPGPQAGERFDQLLEACVALAELEGLPGIEAGVSLACENAYRRMRVRGFCTVIQGVAMHKPSEPAYHRADAYVLDDWR